MNKIGGASVDPGHDGYGNEADLATRFTKLTGLTVEVAADIVYREAVRRAYRDKHIAQDLAQSTWLRILEELTADRLTPLKWPQAWLRQLVRRIAIDAHRRDRAGKRHPGAVVQSLDRLAASDEQIDPAATPEEVVVSREFVGRVLAAVAGLPAERRQVVELVMRGHSFGEIAEILEIPIGTAKTRFRAAATRLRGLIDLA